MDDIVQAVAKKTGLPEAQAKMAVETVMDVIKERLPEPFGGQVEAMLNDADTSGVWERWVIC